MHTLRLSTLKGRLGLTRMRGRLEIGLSQPLSLALTDHRLDQSRLL